MKCLYCEKEFKSGESREHIILNNIAGRLESDICCPSCNQYLGKTIDKEFQKTFQSILGNLESIRGSRTTSKSIQLKSYNSNDKKEYIITKRGNKYFCEEYNKLYKTDVSNHLSDFLFIGNPFNLDNKIFRQGFEKIALNFAYYKGVPRETLAHMFSVNDGKPEIVCLHNVHAFYPVEENIREMELNKDKFRLFHQLHLFNIRLC